MTSQTGFRHPFRWISESAQGRALALLAALLVLLSIALSAVGAALFTEAAPQGIVSYEFAGCAAGAERILGSWSAAAREHAMLSLGLDYLYLLVYPAFISLACVRVSRRLEGLRPGVARLGIAPVDLLAASVRAGSGEGRPARARPLAVAKHR